MSFGINNNSAITSPTSVLPLNQWTHIAGTYDGNALHLFANGQEVATGVIGSVAINDGGEIQIGHDARNAVGDRQWTGAIDEVDLFNRALSPSEIQSIFNAGTAGKSFATVVTTAADEDNGSADPSLGTGTSLREAINYANTNPGTDVIGFDIPGASNRAGLLRQYRGEGNTNDSAGSHDGTTIGTVTYEDAEVGQGFRLANSLVQVPGPFTFSTTNAITLEAWFKFDSSTGYSSIISAGTSSGGPPATYNFMVSPSLRLIYNPGTIVNAEVGPTLSLGQFYHAALVVTGGGTAQVYLNGQLISDSAVGVPAVLPNAIAFNIGAGEAVGVHALENGVIDEPAIYNRALSAAEIQNIFNIGSIHLPVAGEATIHVGGTGLGALPTITDPVIIDGYSQPGSSPNTNGPGLGDNAVPLIELDGTGAGASANGLTITAGSSTVRGLVIDRFSGNGLALSDNGDNVIQGNFIGTDAAGTAGLGNGGDGVRIVNSSDNQIGGTNAAPVTVQNGSFEAVQFGTQSSNVADVPGWSHTGGLGDGPLWGIGYNEGVGMPSRSRETAASS